MHKAFMLLSRLNSLLAFAYVCGKPAGTVKLSLASYPEKSKPQF